MSLLFDIQSRIANELANVSSLLVDFRECLQVLERRVVALEQQR